MLTEAALSSFIAVLFSMTNPIGNVGVFASMTGHLPPSQVRRIAWTCAVAVAITLLLVAWGGSYFLQIFGITVDSLRAAGGVIVLIIGLRMLFNDTSHQHTPEEITDAKQRSSIAVVPLAIPMVAGPGTIAAVLVAAQQHHTILNRAEMSVVIVAISALCGLLFHTSTTLSKWLGVAGMSVVTRIMGMVLAAIAMGMLIDGLTGMMPGLAG